MPPRLRCEPRARSQRCLGTHGWSTPTRYPMASMTGSERLHMEPFRWRRALFLGLVSYAASLAGLVYDTFVPVLLQAGHPLWRNDTGLHAPLGGFGLAPRLAFFIMTWDNLMNIVVHPWAGVRSG